MPVLHIAESVMHREVICGQFLRPICIYLLASLLATWSAQRRDDNVS